MDVKRGYTKTDLGILPVEWSVAELSSLGPFVTSGSRGWADHYAEHGDAFIRITNMSRKSIRLDLTDLKQVALPPTEREGARTQLRDGDLLISITADIGIVGLVDDSVPKPAYINQHIALVRFDESKVDTRFLAYLLASEYSQRAFRAATDQGAKAGMNLAEVRKILGAFPPLVEQRAVAAVMSDMDALLGTLEKLIAKKRDLKQAAAQQLLTGQTRLPGFHGKWELKLLGGMAQLRTGPFGSALHKSDYTIDGIPIVNPMHIVSGCIVPTESMTITESAAQGLSDFRLAESDIVIGRRGEMGRCAVVQHTQSGWICGTGSMIIRVSEILCPSFLQRVLSSPRVVAEIVEASVGTTMINLNQGVLSRLRVETPSMEEQRAIAAVLSDMDAEIAALEARRDKTRLLKQGMMQELLTGRTRLV